MNNPEKATATLVLALLDARRQNVEDEFRRLVSQAGGRTFGESLAQWAADKAGIEADPQVGMAVEMAIRHFESASAIPTEADIIEWIRRQGGTTGLRSAYMAELDNAK